jgi:NAD(P)-dependent dehydrogenase (short-subunit alcohol dehydrogenase family)
MPDNAPAKLGAVVVTGASTGIGEACALYLDRIGYQVFAGVRKEADGSALKQRSSGRLVQLLLDVTEAGSIAAAADTVKKAVGDSGLLGLVNNAGVSLAGPLEFLPIDVLRQQLEVNVVGQIAVTQAFLPLLRKGQGRIVNMGSVAGKLAMPFLGPYAASKFALEALTDSLRVELAPWNIHVSIVEPGNIATPIWNKGIAAADDLTRRLPPEALALYGPAIAGMRRVVATLSQRGTSADSVALAVAHALTSTRPRTRYVVGRGARLRIMLGRLPDRMRDRLLLRALGLARKG